MKLLMKVRLIAGLLCFSGCATPNPSSVVSGVDAHFKLRQSKSEKTHLPSSPGVGFYQNVISSTLGSDCKYFPSDSAYAQIVTKKCGPIKTTLKSFARFSREPDAAFLGIHNFIHDDKIHFEDIPYDCDWMD